MIKGTSWNLFKPRGVFPKLEPLDSYLQRIRMNDNYNHIPDEVFAQWIYPHHNNEETLKNYAWIDYNRIKFKLTEWEFPKLNLVNIIERYQNTQDHIDSPFSKVSASKEDMEVWTSVGTWQTPPIIIDVNSVSNIAPSNAELRGPFQLVEGHSRFSNLKIAHYQNLKLSTYHRIYLMTVSES